MNFDLVSTEFFLGQIKKLSEKYKKQVQRKLELIKQNPFRFKNIHSKKFSRVFRVRMKIEGKEMRLIYAVVGTKIIIAGLLDRSKEYSDLENYLSKI
jgi:mRNA-degrading endonuclease RelE of RelBE toxin-antitoxin system